MIKKLQALMLEALLFALAPIKAYVERNLVCWAYLGSTELSSVTNPPKLLTGFAGGGDDLHVAGGTTMLTFNNYGLATTASTAQPGRIGGGRIWHYFTTDVTTAVLNSGYFTDAGQMGMRPFDIIAIVACGTSNSTASLLRWTYVTSISTAGAAVLSSGLTSTS